MEKNLTLHLKNFEFPSPRDALHDKFGWNWYRGSEEEKLTDEQGDGRRTECDKEMSLPRVFSSGELKITNKQTNTNLFNLSSIHRFVKFRRRQVKTSALLILSRYQGKLSSHFYRSTYHILCKSQAIKIFICYLDIIHVIHIFQST